MPYSAKHEYLKSATKIDSLFNLPRKLHSTYVTSFQHLLETIHDLPATYKMKVTNALQVLQNISPDSLQVKNQEDQKVLNEQAFVLLVSTSEYKLKEVFQLVLEKNLEVFSDSQIKVPTEVLREKGYAIGREDWARIIYSQLQEKENPNEKLHFQNIKTIQQLFRQYFKVDIVLDEDVITRIHIYFQIRHNIVHNLAIVDEQLLRNVKKAGKEFPVKVGGSYLVTEEYYTRARETIAKLFEAIDKAIQEKGLKT